MTVKGKVLWVTSLYGYKAKQPLVAITMPGGESVQMSPAEARHHALAVLECAEAAEGDGFIIEFVRNQVGAGEAGIAGLLTEFRDYREKLRSQR